MNAENIKEFATLIKAAFSALGKETEHKFKQETLQDGTVVAYDGETPQLNAPLFVVTPDGQQLPCPDGEVTLPSGLVATVVSGVITELEPANAPEAPDPETPAVGGGQGMNETNLTQPQAKAIIESIVRESRFAEELKEQFSAVTKENEELKAKIAELEKASAAQLQFSKQVAEAVEKLGDMPSENPAKPEGEAPANKKKSTSMEEFRKANGIF